ncbi:UDP-N-acetylmuramoyl-L-alanine--D-glutamate ligase [Alcaligenaceae bacterium CGII-47]|nr:UDP-N-acetylmuramoyl-L-alanine--D-glutamate ligase [Alcaligenaceae bacterium CGII-47]
MNRFDFPSVRRDGLTLILGLGETGVAAALWCAQHGAMLRVLDTRDHPAGLDALRDMLSDVEYRFGSDVMTVDALEGVHTIVLSPGLYPREAPVVGFLAQAHELGIEVLGEIELFARALDDMKGQGYAPAVLAITGTNGKTTVTALTRRLIQAAGLQARAAGNISPAALASLRQALVDGDLPDVWVLELSSYQLAATSRLKPDAAVVLNLTQDHLDWHGSMEAYGAAKARVLQMAKIAIVNRDDALVCAMVPDIDGMDVRSVGMDRPVRVGDMGLDLQGGVNWLSAMEADEELVPDAKPRRGSTRNAPTQRMSGRLKALMPVEALHIRGMHNAVNGLAALALGRCLGLGWAPMLHALRDYRGEAHRTEFIMKVAGVDFVDDSKGTNVGATLAAIQGLGCPQVLIAGGLGKGQDFSPLAPAVRAHVRTVLLIGQDAGIIEQALAHTGVPILHCATLEEAVAQSLNYAQPGDAVMLSPACASMDMFRNYVHRSACFVAAVRELASDRGEVA